MDTPAVIDIEQRQLHAKLNVEKVTCKNILTISFGGYVRDVHDSGGERLGLLSTLGC